MNPKVAIVVGHTPGTGARSIGGVQEWEYNNVIAEAMVPMLEKRGIQGIIYHRNPRLRYGAAMTKHARDIKRDGCVAGMELHFNSSSRKTAKGVEYWHWWGSKDSKQFARFALTNHNIDFPYQKSRGLKKAWYHRWNEWRADGGRGGAILYKTHCPFIITEPFFGSNASDWGFFKSKQKALAACYSDTFEGFLLWKGFLA